MGRYGTREREIDHLVRNNVFVDLYTVVRQGIVVGEPSYSIKSIEHLYREGREGEITTSVGSIIFYERWLDSGDSTDWADSEILQQIREYNRDDRDSTHMLYEWLLERQREAGIAYLRQEELRTVREAPEGVSPVAAERRDLSVALLNRAEQICPRLAVVPACTAHDVNGYFTRHRPPAPIHHTVFPEACPWVPEKHHLKFSAEIV
jgi:uncharacterized protein